MVANDDRKISLLNQKTNTLQSGQCLKRNTRSPVLPTVTPRSTIARIAFLAKRYALLNEPAAD
jgi:hypothetical protein